MARPSMRTAKIEREICDRLAKGEPLAQICRSEGMPGLRTVYDWTEGDPELSARIARARDAGEEVIAAECLTIADTPQEGIETTTDEDGKVSTKRLDMLGHRKLRIETRLKLLAKWNPKRWGEKIEHRGDASAPIPLALSGSDIHG